jgi:S-DNA-T family DNA segregation ATPase FtsK/SpoIIIE
MISTVRPRDHAPTRRKIRVGDVNGYAPKLCPNNKVTRELSNRRDLGLHPVVVLLDEVQNLYSHETYGKEAAKLVLDIIRLGRAFGVILVQATQRPDADSLPKGISANAGIRIARRIMDDYANNAILGAGMYAAGVRAPTSRQRTRASHGWSVSRKSRSWRSRTT